MPVWICLLGLLLLSFDAGALESNASVFRDFSDQGSIQNNSCGSLCVLDQNYVDRLRLEQTFSQRGYFNSAINRQTSIQSYQSSGQDPWMSLSFNANSSVTQAVLERQIRWSMMARDVGISVAEQGRSLTSAMWREIRRPLLHELRDWVLTPYRGKKLSTEKKIEAWVIEQSVDSGAGVLELEANSPGGFSPTNMDFGISDYTLKYRPRVDPLRGRYGLRVRYKKYLTDSKPFFTELGFHYCNPSLGAGRGRCGYQHELSGRISMMTMTRHLRWSAFISYQTESLDEEAYVRQGETFDHKPWVGGVQLTYAFFR